MVFDEDIDLLKNKKKSLLGRTIITIDPKKNRQQLRNMKQENLA